MIRESPPLTDRQCFVSVCSSCRTSTSVLPSTKWFLIPSVHTHENKEVPVHNHYSKNYLGSSLTAAILAKLNSNPYPTQFKFTELQAKNCHLSKAKPAATMAEVIDLTRGEPDLPTTLKVWLDV